MSYPVRALAILLLLSFASACASKVASETPDSAAALDDAGTSAPGASGANVLGEAPLSVFIEPSQARICAGECSTLTARVSSAQGALSYAWSDGLGDASVQRVCPNSTANYHVEVQEHEDATAEFAQVPRSASADFTVTVRDDCVDGEPTPHVTTEACSYRIPLAPPADDFAYLNGVSTLDNAGNSYLAATLSGTAHLGGGQAGLSSAVFASPAQLLLVKLDATCQLVWFRLLPNRLLIDFASDDAGNLALLTSDERQDVLFATPYYRNHLSLLNTRAEPVWDVLEPEYDVGAFGASARALSFAPDGGLVARFLPSHCAPSSDPMRECVLALDAQGNVRWSLWLSSFATGLSHDRSGNLLLAGMGGPSGVSVGERSDTASQHGPTAYMASVSAAGVLRWLTTTPIAFEALNTTMTIGRTLDDGSAASTWLAPVSQAGQPLNAWRADSAGSARTLITHPVPSPAGFNPLLTLLPDGDLLAMALYPDAQAPDDETRRHAVLMRLSSDLGVIASSDVSSGSQGYGSEIAVRRDGALAFSVAETDGAGHQTALVMHVRPAAPE